MATIIDALIVTLGLDGEHFKHGLEQANEQLSTLQEGVASLVGVFAFKEMVQLAKETTEARKSAADLSVRIGENVEELQKWQQAIKLSEGSAGGMNATLESLNTKLGTMGGPLGKRSIRMFQNLSKDFTEAALKGKKPLEVLDMISDKIDGMAPHIAAGKLRRLGFDATMIDFFLQGRDSIKGFIAESERLGVTSEANIEKSVEFDRAMNLTDATMSKIKGQLVTALTPALVAFTKVLTAVAEWARLHPKTVQFAFLAIATAIGVATAAMTALTIASYANPLVWIITAIALALGLVVAGLYLVYKEWEKWTEGGDTALASLFDALSDVYKLFSDSKSVEDFFLKLDELITHAGAFLVYEFTLAFGLVFDGFKAMVREMAKVDWKEVWQAIKPEKPSVAGLRSYGKRVSGVQGLVLDELFSFLTSLVAPSAAVPSGGAAQPKRTVEKTTIHVGEMKVYPTTPDVVGFGEGLNTAFGSSLVTMADQG